MDKLQIPAWLLSMALICLVLLIGVTLVTGVPFRLNGRDYGFTQSPFPIKKFYVTSPIKGDCPPSNQICHLDIALPVTPDKGICYLLSVTGQFGGSGEIAQVEDQGGKYTLVVQRGLGINGLWVQAQCLSFSPL